PFAGRPMEARDAPAVLAVARGLPKWFTAEGLEDIRRDLGSHEGFVAVRGDRTLGFATSYPLDREVAELSWIGVAEEEHGHGIGTALVAAIAEAARRRGHRFLEVSTVADDVEYAPYAETRRFYRARGFADHRVDSKFYGQGDDRYDRLLLRLPL
ncbi:MAG: GNAT family N-acetyltransferase, partial [Candidatus Thermoplasmatota archaeon]